MPYRWTEIVEIDVQSDRDTAWSVLSDIPHWAGLLPHILELTELERRGNNTLLRTRERRSVWLSTTVESAVRIDIRRQLLWRWYRSRILERWSVISDGAGRSILLCEVRAGDRFAALQAKIMVVPHAREMASTIALLAEADSLTRSGRLLP